MPTDFALDIADVSKTFTMHLRGGVKLPVIAQLGFSVAPGECVVLSGPSGAGKSSILKMIYGTYGCDSGHILVRQDKEMIDIVTATPREIIELRRNVIGYVTQFLRAVPRVSTIDIVMGPSAPDSAESDRKREAAANLLRRLNLPERLWALAPATFSGGEQQRVNIARGLLADLPVILLDEPTASLDARNRAEVVSLIEEKKQRGAAIVAIVHDEDVRDAIADRLIDVSTFSSAA